MNTYPTFHQLIGSSKDIVDDRETDYSLAGDAHSRSLYPAIKHKFTIIHILNNTDLATWDTFYGTNRSLAITFAWLRTATNFTCLFGSAPKQDSLDANRTKVTVELIEQ